MKDRLIAFLNHLGIGQDKFEKKVGLARGFVNNTGDGIRKSSIDKILKCYPELNRVWLLTGSGEMLIDEIEEATAPNQLGQNAVIPISQISKDWLLHGVGEMLIDEPKQVSTPQAQIQDTIIQYPLSELNRKNAEIDELKAKLDARDKRIELLEKRLEQKDKKIDGLNEQLLKSSDSTTTGESKLANVG